MLHTKMEASNDTAYLAPSQPHLDTETASQRARQIHQHAEDCDMGGASLDVIWDSIHSRESTTMQAQMIRFNVEVGDGWQRCFADCSPRYYPDMALRHRGRLQAI